MVTTNPFTLNSIADGSFMCIPCGNIVYSTLHTCEEQLEQMAEEAAKLLPDENS